MVEEDIESTIDHTIRYMDAKQEDKTEEGEEEMENETVERKPRMSFADMLEQFKETHEDLETKEDEEATNCMDIKLEDIEAAMDTGKTEDLNLYMIESSQMKDYEEERKHLKMLADCDDAEAQYQYSLYCATAIGGTQDHANALKYAEMAAKNNHSNAQVLLYNLLTGVPEYQSVKNTNRALKWLATACRNGNPTAMSIARKNGLLQREIFQNYMNSTEEVEKEEKRQRGHKALWIGSVMTVLGIAAIFVCKYYYPMVPLKYLVVATAFFIGVTVGGIW